MIGLTCANSTHANNLMESSTRFALPVYPKTDSRNMSNYSRAGKSVAIHSRKITAKEIASLLQSVQIRIQACPACIFLNRFLRGLQSQIEEATRFCCEKQHVNPNNPLVIQANK